MIHLPFGAYDRAVVLFVFERSVPHSVEESWRRLTDWPRHAAVVPLTRVTVRTPPPTRVGTVFVARSGMGPLAFDDPMEVVTWQPPAEGRPGRCRLVKLGTFVTGWAEIEVHPASRERPGAPGPAGAPDHPAAGSRVVWREDLSVRWLPGAADRTLHRTARWMFGRAVDGLLRTD